MLADSTDKTVRAQKIVHELASIGHGIGHDRHINKDEVRKIGLNIKDLETDPKFQDVALTVHHSFIHTLSNGPILKAIENHNGVGMFNYAKQN